MIGTEEAQQGNQKWWQAATSLNARLRVVYGAGIAVSFSALFELAVDYGGWVKPFGVAMPLVIDVYWMTALGVATDSARGKRERRWAAVHAFFAIALSITGNIMFHEFQTGGWKIDKHAQSVLVAVLACIPVVLTGTLTHLVLVARGQLAEPSVPAPADRSTDGRHRRTTAPAAPTPPAAPAAPAGSTDGNRLAAPAAPARRTDAPAPAGTDGDPAESGNGSRRRDAGERRPAARHRAAGARAPRSADPALCKAVVEEIRTRKRPALEDAHQQVARAEKIIAEFRQRTGERINNQELGLAMGVHKSKVAAIRDAVTEPAGERQEAAG